MSNRGKEKQVGERCCAASRRVRDESRAEAATTVHAVGQSLAIGPIFSAGLVIGLVAHVSGYTTPLSVLLGCVGALGLGYVIAIYARRFAGAGAIYEYLSQAAHNSFGIFSAGVYSFGMLMLGAGGIYIGLGFLTQGFFANHLHTSIPWWVGGAAALLIAFVLNHYGVRIAIRGVLVMATFSVIPFLILSVVVIGKGGVGGNTLQVFNPNRLRGTPSSTAFCSRWRCSSASKRQPRSPRKPKIRDRSMPIAMVTTVGLSAAFYLLVSYAGTIGFGRRARQGCMVLGRQPDGTAGQHLRR